MPIFLRYIYTGRVDKMINEDNVTEVLKLADKFELDELREICLLYLETKINRSTVIPILLQAAHYNNERLKSKCIDFINREAIDLIDSPQWQNLKRENPAAALDLYEARIKAVHEQDKQQTSRSDRFDHNGGGGGTQDDDSLKTSRKSEAIKNSNSGISSNSRQSKFRP